MCTSSSATSLLLGGLEWTTTLFCFSTRQTTHFAECAPFTLGRSFLSTRICMALSLMWPSLLCHNSSLESATTCFIVTQLGMHHIQCALFLCSGYFVDIDLPEGVTAPYLQGVVADRHILLLNIVKLLSELKLSCGCVCHKYLFEVPPY